MPSALKAQAQAVPDSTQLEQALDSVIYFLFTTQQPAQGARLLKPLMELTADQINGRHFARIQYCNYIAFRETGALDSAIVAGSRAKEAFVSIGDSLWTGILLRMVSQDYVDRAQYVSALQNLHAAIEIFTQLQDTAWLIKSRSGISTVYHQMREYDQGIAYGRRTEELAKFYASHTSNQNAWVYYMDVLTFIAVNYDDRGDQDSALSCYQQAENIAHLLPDSSYMGQVYGNMGNSLLKLGRYPEAEQYLKRALVINRQRGRHYNVISSQDNLGVLALKQHRLAEARHYLLDARRLAEELNNVERMKDVYLHLAEYYQAAGSNDSAIIFLQQHHGLKDSLVSLAALKELNALQTRFETREKEVAIRAQANTIEKQELVLERNTALIAGLAVALALLIVLWGWWRNRVRKQQEAELSQLQTEHREAQLTAMIDSQEQERKRFASDLHDGLGQLMSVLRMSVQRLADRVNVDVPDEPDDQTDPLQQSNMLLDSMYVELKAICFDMMPHALSIGGLQAAFSELASRVTAGGTVTLKLHAHLHEQRSSERVEVAVFRMGQEWTNNVLKYSKATAIDLELTSDAQELTLMISDNGKGFDPAILETAAGNGWKNIGQRAHLINGEVNVESSPGRPGTSFILNVPLSR